MRRVNLDILKGMAMSCVLLGHVIQLCNGEEYASSEAFFANPVYKFIYSFHLPVFAIISGYLVGMSMERRSVEENIIRKSKQLLLPILSLMLLYAVLSTVFALIRGDRVEVIVFLRSLASGLESFWFLWAIFLAFMAVAFVRRLSTTVWTDVLWSVVVILLIFIVDVRFFVNAHKYIISLYWAGYLLYKYRHRLNGLEKRYRKPALTVAWGGGNSLPFQWPADLPIHRVQFISECGGFLGGLPSKDDSESDVSVCNLSCRVLGIQ